MSNHTVFGHGYKLNRYDYNSSTGEKGSDSKTMSKPAYWKADINSICSSTSTTPILSNATPANIGVICDRKLQLSNKIIRRGENRTAMAGTESSLKQWEVSYILSSPVTNSLRCIFRRVGCILSRTQNKGTMDIIREKRSYKYLRIESSKIGNFNFLSLVPNCKYNSYKNGQHCCPFLFGENGRYLKSITYTDKQGNLGIFTGQKDYN